MNDTEVKISNIDKMSLRELDVRASTQMHYAKVNINCNKILEAIPYLIEAGRCEERIAEKQIFYGELNSALKHYISAGSLFMQAGEHQRVFEIFNKLSKLEIMISERRK